MIRVSTYCFAGLVMASLLAGRASAVVVQESVTPAFIKEKNSKFSVTAEKDKAGLIQFTITYRLPRAQWLVAHFELRDGETLLISTDTPNLVREESVTYYVAVAPKQLAGAKFELSENALGEAGGRSVPVPGGAIFQIDLQAFGKDAPAARGD
jgi:hypothetical protein